MMKLVGLPLCRRRKCASQKVSNLFKMPYEEIEADWIPAQVCQAAEPMPTSILSKRSQQGALIKQMTSPKKNF